MKVSRLYLWNFSHRNCLKFRGVDDERQEPVRVEDNDLASVRVRGHFFWVPWGIGLSLVGRGEWINFLALDKSTYKIRVVVVVVGGV